MTMRLSERETALVIGLGRSGRAVTEVLRARNVAVFAVDEKPAQQLTQELAMLASEAARFVSPSDLPGLLSRVNFAVLSPGVPQSGPLVRAVRDAGVPIYGEIELAYRLCEAPMIAITGTKGKSTTTALTAHLLASAGRRPIVGGNIGKPLVREVLDATPLHWVVAEVSSFQLETIETFRPRVAALLNLSEDHLDRYPSMETYAEAKFRIFANQGAGDTLIVNRDDDRLADLAPDGPQVWRFSARSRDAVMFLDGDAIVYAPPGAARVEIARRADVALPGEHNLLNVMAAALCSIAAGVEPTRLRDGIRSFRGMAHRLEMVQSIDGVDYVDDSKATNPEAVIAALHAYDRPIVLLAGGKSKQTDFHELGRVVDRRAKAAILIGEAAGEIAAAIASVQTVRAATLEAAVEAARAIAEPGDVVLLSPGCASFDMFGSAEDRGERFAGAVRALLEAAGA